MANFNFNKVIIGGRLTADPEMKTTPSGIAVTTFTVAVNRRGGKDEQKTDFLNVTAWRQTAEFVCKYFRKASNICIVGSVQTRSWEKDGQKRFVTEIVADEACFVDSKDELPIMANPPVVPTVVPGVQTSVFMSEAAPQFEELNDDEPLPF